MTQTAPQGLNTSQTGGRLRAGFVPFLVVFTLTFVWLAIVANTELKYFSLVQYDDSYITYRYAENLASGKGLIFNVEDKTNSASSMLWTLLLAAWYWIAGTATPVFALWVSVVCAALTSATLFQTVRLRHTKNFNLGSLLAPVIFLSASPVIYWVYSGMETSLFLFLLALSIFLSQRVFVLRIYSTSSFLLVSLVFILLTLVRWEGALVALVLSFFIIIKARGPGAQTTRKSFLLRALPMCSTVFTVFSLLIFYRSYYGFLVPDSIFFKRISDYYTLGFVDSFLQVIKFFVVAWWWPALIFIILLVIYSLYLVVRRHEFKLLRIVAIPTMTMMSLMIFLSMSSYGDAYRYQVPMAVPLSIIVGQMFYLIQEIKPSLIPTNALKDFDSRSVFSFIGLVMVVLLLIWNSSARAYQLTSFLNLQESRIIAGKWLNENLEAGTVVLSSDIGAISYYAKDMRIIDASGLTNHALLTAINSGMAYDEFIRSQNPEYLVDTVDATGTSGSQYIFDQPESYYDANQIDVKTICKFVDAYTSTEVPLSSLRKEAQSAESLRVGVFQLVEKEPTYCR
jgi:hypothetical protein